MLSFLLWGGNFGILPGLSKLLAQPMQRRDRLVGFGVHMLELLPVPLNHRVNVVALVVRIRLELLFFVGRSLLWDNAHTLPPDSFLLNFGKIGVATHEIVHVHNLGLV